jgi:hypothetical protein
MTITYRYNAATKLMDILHDGIVVDSVPVGDTQRRVSELRAEVVAAAKAHGQTFVFVPSPYRKHARR